MTYTRQVRQLLGGAAVSVLGAMAPIAAHAQAPADKAAKEIEEVVVVGTNISGVKPVGAEAVVIDNAQIERSGYSNAADLLRTLPQVQTGGVDPGGSFQGGGPQNSAYASAGAETVGLRGLGAAATLVLIDGRRALSGGAAVTNTDANQVPLAALQRIEVLSDGASALYGSDAVGGVINFVLRKDFDGAEVFGRYANTSGADEFVGGVTAGTRWSSFSGLGEGNILISWEHQDRDNYRSSRNPRLRFDQRPLGGADFRISGATTDVGAVPNIVADTVVIANPVFPLAGTNRFFGVPEGNGAGLTLANLRLNDPNLVDRANYLDYFGKQRRDQVAVYLNQDLTETLEFFATAYYLNRKTEALQDSGSQRISLATTPFMIAGLPANSLVQYAAAKDHGGRVLTGSNESYSGTVGFKAQLPSEWQGEVFFTYGENEQCDACITNNLNVAALQAQANAGAINPLSSIPLSADLQSRIYADSIFRSRTTLTNSAAKFNGPLFDLPGGTVRAAVGVEYRRDTNANLNTSTFGPTNAPVVLQTFDTSKISRNIKSVFGELYVPLIGEEMNVPLVRGLQASAAVRYDDYSDVGDTTNPRLGLTWEVSDNLRFSGTWGTSFRAPSVTDSNPNAIFSASALPLPFLPQAVSGVRPGLLPPGLSPAFPFGLANAVLLLGSNPDLEPETADTWSVSGIFERGGFSFKATYYDVKYKDQITFPGVINGVVSAVAGNPTATPTYQGFGNLVIPVNNPATCTNSNILSADPKLIPILQGARQNFVAGGFGGATTIQNSFCNINVIVDSRIVNVAKTHQAGIDASVTYVTQLGDVDLTLGLSGTRILKNRVQPAPGQPSESRLSLATEPVKLRINGNVSADWRDFNATVYVRYYGSYDNNQLRSPTGAVLPLTKISDRTFVDLTLGYSKTFNERNFGIMGWRAQVAIQDLFNKNLAYEPQNTPLGLSFNRLIGLPFGRTYSAQLTATF